MNCILTEHLNPGIRNHRRHIVVLFPYQLSLHGSPAVLHRDRDSNMLNIFLVCGMALGWILLDSTSSMAQVDARAVDQVTALVARYDSSWNRKDTVAVSRLMAPGYQYFTSLGGVRPRAAILEFLGSPEYVLQRAQRSELRVTQAGPVAVVSSRWKGHGTYRARRFVDDQRCGQVWLQMAGAWRILSEHCVQIVPDPWAASE